MKKITILTGPLAGHGGEETVIVNFIRLLSDQFVFDVVLPENLGETDWLDKVSDLVENKYINNTGNSFGKLRFILESLHKSKSDIIICLTPRMTFLAELAKKIFFKDFIIITWVQFAIDSKFGPKTAKLLKKADLHFAINSGIRQNLLSLGITPDRILLTYNPVCEKAKTIPKTTGKRRFIYIGRIQYSGEKNLSELLKSLPLLSHKKEWVLDIYGADDSPGNLEITRCKNLIDEFGLQKNVHWCGFKKDVWNEISAADCLILTSTSEGFGMVLCEAISYGVPVISSDCPSGPADIVNDQNGYLYHLGNKEQLATYLNSFIEGRSNFLVKNVKDSISKMYYDEYKNRIELFLKKKG